MLVHFFVYVLLFVRRPVLLAAGYTIRVPSNVQRCSSTYVKCIIIIIYIFMYAYKNNTILVPTNI